MVACLRQLDSDNQAHTNTLAGPGLLFGFAICVTGMKHSAEKQMLAPQVSWDFNPAQLLCSC